MKKLILLLTLTMMFGQSKLETRVYSTGELNADDIISLSELTGFDLEYYIVSIVGASNVPNYQQNVTMSFPEDSNTILTAKIYGADDVGVVKYDYGYPNHQILYMDEIEYSGSSNLILKLAITAEFPIEDTGYIEDGFDYCVEPGANLMSYPCDSAVALLDAIPSDALSQFSGIIGQGIAATQLPNGTWVGSLTAMQASSGYWIQSNTSLCFNYDCSEN